MTLVDRTMAPVEPDARYRDPSLAIDGRVEDLLTRMTLAEKLAQMGSFWAFEVLTDGALDAAKADQLMEHGIGQVTRVVGSTNLGPREGAQLANAIQRHLVERTRLGIPAIVHEESLHGVMGRDRVCYPQSIGLAATWDPALVERMAARIGRDLRAGGAQQTLAPVIDISRDPRWGRFEETYGEDPYLVAAMGVAYVRGIQGPDGGRGPDGVLATGKHMVGHGVPEGGLNHAPAHLGPRELRDRFLLPFEAAVRVGGIRSMMHAYDDLDGVPCVASRELLTDDPARGMGLRRAGGLRLHGHRAARALAPSGRRRRRRGAGWPSRPVSTSTCPPRSRMVRLWPGRSRPGTWTSRSSTRPCAGRCGRSSPSDCSSNPIVDVDASELSGSRVPEDRALARLLARSSIVLLRNEGVLPLAAPAHDRCHRSQRRQQAQPPG